MKRSISIFMALLFTLPMFAGNGNHHGKKGGDQWLCGGIRAGAVNTWLMNKNMMNDKGLKYQPSFGGTGGLMLGFHFSEWGAIEVEGLYALYNQKFKSASSVDSLAWTSKTSLTYLEFPILLHFDTQNFKYIEVGVKIGMLNSAKGTFDYPKYAALDYANKDIKADYNKMNTAIVFGWGTGIWGNGGLLMNMGIRLTYGIADIVNQAGNLGGNYHPVDNTSTVKEYMPTNTATISLHMNMDFDIGWFMTSSCGRSHKFVLFGH
ncbi:MAG TPA: porin family protein [Bacteroidia bacterium]